MEDHRPGSDQAVVLDRAPLEVDAVSDHTPVPTTVSSVAVQCTTVPVLDRRLG